MPFDENAGSFYIFTRKCNFVHTYIRIFCAFDDIAFRSDLLAAVCFRVPYIYICIYPRTTISNYITCMRKERINQQSRGELMFSIQDGFCLFSNKNQWWWWRKRRSQAMLARHVIVLRMVFFFLPCMYSIFIEIKLERRSEHQSCMMLIYIICSITTMNFCFRFWFVALFNFPLLPLLLMLYIFCNKNVIFIYSWWINGNIRCSRFIQNAWIIWVAFRCVGRQRNTVMFFWQTATNDLLP